MKDLENMKDEVLEEKENEENDLEYEIERLRKQVNILKLVQIVALIIILAVFVFFKTEINTSANELQSVSDKLDAVSEYVGYSESLSDTDEKTEKAMAFLNSDFVINNKLDKSTSIYDTLHLSDSEYYVLFYMESCSHCIEVESVMDTYANRDDKLPLYFYDAANIDETTAIQFNAEGEDIKYTMTEENFSIIGTPTLIKVSNGTATAYVGPEAIISELNL